jgi:selenide,water dikinase
MARGAGLTARLDPDGPALLAGVEELARAGVRTGASGRNWASYGDHVRGAEGLADWKRDLLCDPQTSGGLLVAAAPKSADEVLELLRARGFIAAAMVGRLHEGPAQIEIAG